MTLTGRLALTLLAPFFFSCNGHLPDQSTILLQDGWRIRLGDDTAWASPRFDDLSWSPIVPGLTEPAIFNDYDGYAWYRTKVLIPSALKEAPHVKDSLIIFLGKIDDCDQVYLNGRLLGQNMLTAPPGTTADIAFTKIGGLWQKERKYTLSVTDSRILWDQANTIAIRVFDQSGGGGLYGKTPYIGIMGLNEYIVFDLSRFYTLDQKDSLEKRFSIKNISPGLDYEGTLSVRARDRETGEQAFDWEGPLRLTTGDSALIPVTLPATTDSLDVTVLFRDANAPLVAIDSVNVPYALSPQPKQPL